jgi:hypothetical protein
MKTRILNQPWQAPNLWRRAAFTLIELAEHTTSKK